MESEKWLLANTKDREFKFLCAFLTSIPNNLQEKYLKNSCKNSIIFIGDTVLFIENPKDLTKNKTY